jgi:hypothetical protein
MRTVIFQFSNGQVKGKIQEEVEYEDEITDEEIDEDFEKWLWENSGASWYDKE